MLVAVVTIFAFAACAPNEVVDKGSVTVVEYVAEGNATEYSVKLSDAEGAKSLIDVLNYLKEKKNVNLVLEDSQYGAFITAFGSLKAEEGTSYISLYTSVESDFGVSEWAKEISYKNVKLVSSGVGASGMKLEDGAIYLITLGSY